MASTSNARYLILTEMFPGVHPFPDGTLSLRIVEDAHERYRVTIGRMVKPSAASCDTPEQECWRFQKIGDLV